MHFRPSVGIETSLRDGRPGFHSRKGAMIGLFIFVTVPIQPPVQWIPEALIPGVKWPESETDRSPTSSAKVKNAWRHISTPKYILMALCLIKQMTRLPNVVLR